MKALLTIALAASALTLSSCANGSCPFGFKKKACPANCAKPCCAKKEACCKH